MLSGFFNRGKKGPSTSGKDAQSSSDSMQMYSQAAAALAAAASANVSNKSAGPRPTGRNLQGANITIDIDELRPNETVPELQVQPITLLKFDYKLEHTQQVAISSSYICYGLKAGHIRALDRNTASRALFKGHTASLSYMAFFNPETNLLASASRNADLTVRRVLDQEGPDGGQVPGETVMMTAQLPLPASDITAAAAAAPVVTLAWHPLTAQILAAGAGNAVNIFEVPTEAPAVQPPAPVTAGITYTIPASTTAAFVTAVAFSPGGDLLVAADSTGQVHAWSLEAEEESDVPVLSWQPFSSGGAVASVHFLHQAANGSTLLLTGDATNRTLKLWALPAAEASAGKQPVCLQSVCFTSAKGSEDFFCHVVVQPELQLVVLANTVRKQVYTLHYSIGSSAADGAAAAQLDYAAFFSVKQPILSLTTGLESVESQAVPGVVQPQQLLLYTVQTDAIQQYVVNPALCSSGDAGGTAAAVAAADDVEEVEEGEEVSSSAPAAVTPDSTPAPASKPAALAEPEPAAAAAATADASASSASVPPPATLPTPGRLLKVADYTGLLDKQIAIHGSEEAAREHIGKELQRKKDALRAALEKTHQAGAAAVETGSDAAAAAVATAAGNREAEQPAAAAPAAAADKAAEQPEASAAASEASADTAAPLPPMPTTSLLHSAEKGPAPAAPAPAAAATEEEAVPAPQAAAAAPDAGVAALQQQMQQLLAMQQELVAQLQGNPQQTVAGVKSELGRALKVSEATIAKQVEGAIKAAVKKAEEERKKGAAKERQELEKTMAAQLAQLSSSLQRDLVKAMADTAREQARAAVTATVNGVTPAVAAAVASALQRELAGGAGGGQLQAVLERSLASSLARPLHEALRENFAASIIPAFERATQVMFGQVESAFTSWLAESNRTMASAQSEAASALATSVSQLQSVVGSMRGDLADTSRSLNRIASAAASRAAEAAGSGGGAGALSVAQLEAGAGARAAPADPRIEIGTLLGVRKFEEALAKALNTASLDVLIWTCKQVDPALVLGGSSVSLSQTTLLSLVHQLSVELVNDSNAPLKLAWLAEAAPVVDPHDPVTAPHIKVVLTGVMNALKQLVNSLPQNDALAKRGRITLHLFNSLLHQ